MAQTRDFSHILVDDGVDGPSITIGDSTVRFKSKQPLGAVIMLIDESVVGNALTRSQDYLRASVLPEDTGALESAFNKITAEGLGEIVEWLAQAYTGFPTANSPA
jgi:hypothetical protein